MRVDHKRVRTTRALVETIVSETWIAHADGTWSFLNAHSMAIAIFFTSMLSASTSFLTEAISVSVVSINTLRAVDSGKQWMTDTHVIVAIMRDALCRA